MFRLDDIKVYQKALPFAASAENLSAGWGRRHAVVDQFRRASESIVVSIAEGARIFSGPQRATMADVALGSTFECAACLDVAGIKGFLSEQIVVSNKARLLEITRMLVGLRRGWLRLALKEEPASPEGVESGRSEFHHETLDVYKTAMEFMRWLVALPGTQNLSNRLCREIDKGATSVALNVAEGNGRYSELDHRRFLEIAAASAAKTTVYLDLYEQKRSPGVVHATQGKFLLSRIIAMLAAY